MFVAVAVVGSFLATEGGMGLAVKRRSSRPPLRPAASPRVRLHEHPSADTSLIEVELPRERPDADAVMAVLREDGVWIIDRREQITPDSVKLWLVVTEVGGRRPDAARSAALCASIVRRFAANGDGTLGDAHRRALLTLV